MQYINTWFLRTKILLAGLLVSATTTFPLVAKLDPGDTLPDLSGFNLEGELPDIEGKVVLLDFWASWCAPCKASFPAMDELYKELKDEGFVILAVSVDARTKDYEAFAEKSGVSFPLVRDADNELVKLAEIEVMPTSLMIDKTRKIRSVHRGYQGKKTIDSYRTEARELLEE